MRKRIFDFIFALIFLIILTPFFLIIGLFIRMDSNGPIFFVQDRVGLLGSSFRIYKFRTMFEGSDKQGKLTIGFDARVTRFGRLLRRWKLDELPQLFNVLRGDMSLVGPRPEIKKYMNYYPEDVQEIILSVRPGITDSASIELINESQILSKFNDPEMAYIEKIIPKKQALYSLYVRERSFLGDLKIIFLTLKRIFYFESEAR